MMGPETNNGIQIKKLEVPPYGTNTYVIVCKSTGDSVLIDAPGETNKILELLKGTNPMCILMTHAHMDHVGALIELKSKLKIPVGSHQLDASGLPVTPDILLNDGDEVSFGDIRLKVLHTPGHTPGSLCFLTGQHLISGDTIFPGGPGRTGSPAAMKQILESITGKIFTLPDETQVYPGHGNSTVLKKEKEEYAAFAARTHDPDLSGDVLWLSS